MAYAVGIAGCGVAGLTAAVMLARQGHQVTIHEQSPGLGPVGAGVLLQPTGQMVLEAMGLLSAVVRDAEPVARLTAFNHRGKTLIDLPYGELGPEMRAYGLQRGELFTALHEAALAAGVRVNTGERMERHVRRGDGVYFQTNASELRGPYDFVLATDGARSVLRANTTLQTRVHAYPHGALWMNGPCDGVTGRLLQVCRGTRELCGILPTGRGRASLFWGTRNDETDALRGRGFGPWRERVLRLCPEAASIFEEVRDFDDVKFVSYMQVKMPMPYDGDCLFLGDAAHAMSPHLGQGINLALIDGYIFAQMLMANSDFSEACAQYVRSRAAHLRAYRHITYCLSPFFQSRGIIKGWGRDMFLPLMPKIPPLRRQMVLTMAGCRRSLLGGRWEMPAPLRTLTPA